jgi:hypothetical protein
MKCEILYGPEAGTIKHFPNNDPTAHMMIRAGALRMAETEPGDMIRTGNGAVIPKMAPPAQPVWALATINVTNYRDNFERQGVPTHVPAITFTVGTSIYEQYTGEPKEAHTGFGRRVVPDNILKAYAQAYKEFYRAR